MALSPNISTREFDKFEEVSGQTHIRVTPAQASLDQFRNFKTHEVDSVGAITYTLKIDTNSSKYLIEKITESGQDISIRYANQSNADANYLTAWTSRATNSYDYINNLTF